MNNLSISSLLIEISPRDNETAKSILMLTNTTRNPSSIRHANKIIATGELTEDQGHNKL